MDIVALTFYALVCGLLSLLAPNFGGRLQRVIIGAGVGVVAAAILPILRGTLGM
ncbi:MAG: hypothetical protein QNI90_14470 [Dinoroseobacter sp.]|nr:hypothetical protein [Dinoroseobacter sp.]MDJ0994777.1 hypothetical protein [Dinoroseobacter sp.]